MSQRDTVLVYIGANQGNSLFELHDKFDKVYAFEPDPEMFSVLVSRFGEFEWVNLINAACSDYDGESKLYVTPNRVSSSLLMHPKWRNLWKDLLKKFSR